METSPKDLMDQQIRAGILTQEMLNFLQKSLLSGVSMLFCATELSVAVEFLTAFTNSIETSQHPGFVFCHISQIDDLLQNSATTNILAELLLNKISVQALTEFQKLGALVLNPVSADCGFVYLQALLRSQVLATMATNDSVTAISELTKGIIAHVPQITAGEAQKWLIDELPLIIHLQQDKHSRRRTAIVDAGLLHENRDSIPYIYSFDDVNSKFMRKVDKVSFMGRLLEVSPD